VISDKKWNELKSSEVGWSEFTWTKV